MSAIQDADPAPCEECGHEWREHTWRGWCGGYVVRGGREVCCECMVSKGLHTHFGLVLRDGSYERSDSTSVPSSPTGTYVDRKRA
jgi:hypothetical protein